MRKGQHHYHNTPWIFWVIPLEWLHYEISPDFSYLLRAMTTRVCFTRKQIHPPPRKSRLARVRLAIESRAERVDGNRGGGRVSMIVLATYYVA